MADQEVALGGCSGYPGQNRTPMWTTVPETFLYYLRFYRDYALDFWDNITPMQYGCLLIAVAVGGWLMMKSSR